MLDSASWLGEEGPRGRILQACSGLREKLQIGEVHAVPREAVRDQNGQLSVLASFRLSAADVKLTHKFTCGSIVGIDVT